MMLHKVITAATLALGLSTVALSPAEARGGFGGGFHGRFGGFNGGSFHVGIFGFRRGFHAGLGRFAVGRFRGGFEHEFTARSLRGGWKNGLLYGLSAINVGWALEPFIQATIASYFERYFDQYSNEVGGSVAIAPCDAQCISARYLRVTVKAPTVPVVRAVDIPAYDVNHNCSTLQGAPSRNYCLKVEQENYDIIKSLWSDIPDKVKGQTLAKMQDIMRGRPSATLPYTTMKGYLIVYLQAEELTRPAEPFHE